MEKKLEPEVGKSHFDWRVLGILLIAMIIKENRIGERD
jgi:hypothetical protein